MIINDGWVTLLTIIILGSVALGIISWIILRFTLDRRVRKALSPDKIYNAYPDSYGGFMRTLIFGGFCVFDHMNNASMYKELYDNFDVRNFANQFEKLLAYLMVVSFLIFLAFAIFFCITDIFGIIEWPDS